MTVRILAVCGNGQGSSMIMKMKVDQFLTQSNIDHTVNSCAVGEYKSELSGADIIIASTHIAGEITVTGNKYVVGVRNMLSPADFGPKLLEVIKHTTNNVTPPPEACTTWKAMYNGINELIDDLMDHISLENNVLFPRALAGE